LKKDPKNFAKKVSIFSEGFNKIQNIILFDDGLVLDRLNNINSDPFFERLGLETKNRLINELSYINNNYSGLEKQKLILKFKLNAVFDTSRYTRFMSEMAIETPINQWENKV
jgi:hypothetical protein